MKKLDLLFLSIFFTSILFAQWEIKYPDPMLGYLNDIFFISESHGWAAGAEGNIIHTEDGGVSWEIQNSGVTIGLSSIHFGNNNSGWAVGGRFLHTQDGGNTWDSMPSPASTSLTSVYSFGNDSCWVAGYDGIYFTENMGLTWEKQDSSSITIRSLSFIDNSTGWAVGFQVILKTTDAGNTWEPLPGIPGFNPEKVFFTTSMIGYMVASYSITNKRIFKTQDGGFTWDIVLVANGWSLDIGFQNADTGYAFRGGTVYKTTNGGIDWEIVFTHYFPGLGNGKSIFADFDNVWLTGGGNPATVHCSNNMGDSWIQQFPNGPTHQDLLSTDFIDENTGWASGNNGTIIKTIDGGISWILQNPGTTQNLLDIQFLNENSGWIVGDTGTILFTQNGGADWILQNVPVSENFIDVSFVNENNGWVISNNSLLKTSNGGTNWESISVFQSNGFFNSICFTSQQEGWVLGIIDENKGLFHTIDGGSSWNLSVLIENLCCKGNIIFIDDEHGWIMTEYEGMFYGNIGYKTQDGGQSWQIFYGFHPISFINETHGFKTFSSTFEPWGIAETFDGGETWESCFEFNSLYYSCSPRDISFGNNEHAFLVGAKGLIMTWIDPTVSVSEMGENTTMAMKTYPNPFSGFTAIEYELENAAFIQLAIYNHLSQQIYTLFEGYQQQGKRQFMFNASNLPSGIYFCRLQAGNEVVSCKIIKL